MTGSFVSPELCEALERLARTPFDHEAALRQSLADARGYASVALATGRVLLVGPGSVGIVPVAEASERLAEMGSAHLLESIRPVEGHALAIIFGETTTVEWWPATTTSAHEAEKILRALEGHNEGDTRCPQ